MTNGEIIEVAATSESPCWPLPPEWDKAIPPQPTKIVEYHGPPGLTSAGPEWNGQWLLGLEKYVRSIVRDELSKANDQSHASAAPANSVDSLVVAGSGDK